MNRIAALVLAFGFVTACAPATVPSGSPAPSGERPPSRSPAPSEASSSPAATLVLDPVAVTRTCEGDAFPTPTDLDCTDAIAVALGVVAGQPGAVARVEIRWQVICEEGPCGTPTRDTAQAIIRYVDGRAVGVVIHRSDTGAMNGGDDPRAELLIA